MYFSTSLSPQSGMSFALCLPFIILLPAEGPVQRTPILLGNFTLSTEAQTQDWLTITRKKVEVGKPQRN